MKRKVLPLGFVLSALSFAAFAGWDYDGPSIDVNFIQTKPAKYDVCKRYWEDNSPKQVARTCEFARDEAERMAERFGGGNGKLHGFLTGYVHSMQKFARLYEDNGEAMAEGAAAVAGMGQYLNSGLEAGISAGRSQGYSQGNSDAIARFKSVINTNREPDPRISVPATNYQGIDNGYEKYVGSVPTVKDIINKDVTFDDLPVYSSYDSTCLGELTPLSWWDLWSRNGIYEFEKNSWYVGSRALETWKTRPIGTKPDYNILDTQPLLDAAGKPILLKPVFHQVFQESYEYYVNYYFSQEYYRNRDMGYHLGEKVGAQIGKRVAFYKGQVREFNAKFKASSIATFRKAFEGTYVDTFKSTFNDYLTHPKLSLSFDGLVGEMNDGIFQPGEKVKARFTVWNLGGVGSDLSASMGGDVQDSTKQGFKIARFQGLKYETDFIATIDPRLDPRQTARIVLNVNGLTDSIGQVVNNVAEIASAGVRADIQNGSGAVTVSVENVSTLETAAEVQADLYVNGKLEKTIMMGKIMGGDSREAVLEFSKKDPLALIEGKYTFKVVVSMGSKVLDDKELGALNVADTSQEYATYYTQLVNDKGFLPASEQRETRIAHVGDRLKELAHDEVFHKAGGDNIWGNTPTETVIGKLVSAYQSYGTMSMNALLKFNELARVLHQERGHWRNLLSGKRKAYISLCKRLFSEKASGGKSLDQLKLPQHQGQDQS